MGDDVDVHVDVPDPEAVETPPDTTVVVAPTVIMPPTPEPAPPPDHSEAVSSLRSEVSELRERLDALIAAAEAAALLAQSAEADALEDILDDEADTTATIPELEEATAAGWLEGPRFWDDLAD